MDNYVWVKTKNIRKNRIIFQVCVHMKGYCVKMTDC